MAEDRLPHITLYKVIRLQEEDAKTTLYTDDVALKWCLNTSVALKMLYARTDGKAYGALRPETVLLSGSADVTNLEACEAGLAPDSPPEPKEYLNLPLNMLKPAVVYYPPEVLRGGNFTTKGDIYSLGHVMNEVVHRRLWFEYVSEGPEALDLATYIKLVCSNAYRPMLSIPLPPRMQQLITQCWAEDPAKRPDVEHVIKELTVVMLGKGADLSPLYSFRISEGSLSPRATAASAGSAVSGKPGSGRSPAKSPPTPDKGSGTLGSGARAGGVGAVGVDGAGSGAAAVVYGGAGQSAFQLAQAQSRDSNANGSGGVHSPSGSDTSMDTAGSFDMQHSMQSADDSMYDAVSSLGASTMSSSLGSNLNYTPEALGNHAPGLSAALSAQLEQEAQAAGYWISADALSLLPGGGVEGGPQCAMLRHPGLAQEQAVCLQPLETDGRVSGVEVLNGLALLVGKELRGNARLYGIGAHASKAGGKQFFLVEERFSGARLEQLVSEAEETKVDQYGAEDALRWVLQVTAGLAALHELGKAHGAVSLSNVALTSESVAEAEAKLVGVQLAGGSLDEDVRRFGKLLLQLLTGKHSSPDVIPVSVPARLRQLIASCRGPQAAYRPKIHAVQSVLFQYITSEVLEGESKELAAGGFQLAGPLQPLPSTSAVVPGGVLVEAKPALPRDVPQQAVELPLMSEEAPRGSAVMQANDVPVKSADPASLKPPAEAVVQTSAVPAGSAESLQQKSPAETVVPTSTVPVMSAYPSKPLAGMVQTSTAPAVSAESVQLEPESETEVQTSIIPVMSAYPSKPLTEAAQTRTAAAKQAESLQLEPEEDIVAQTSTVPVMSAYPVKPLAETAGRKSSLPAESAEAVQLETPAATAMQTKAVPGKSVGPMKVETPAVTVTQNSTSSAISADAMELGPSSETVVEVSTAAAGTGKSPSQIGGASSTVSVAPALSEQQEPVAEEVGMTSPGGEMFTEAAQLKGPSETVAQASTSTMGSAKDSRLKSLAETVVQTSPVLAKPPAAVMLQPVEAAGGVESGPGMAEGSAVQMVELPNQPVAVEAPEALVKLADPEMRALKVVEVASNGAEPHMKAPQEIAEAVEVAAKPSELPAAGLEAQVKDAEKVVEPPVVDENTGAKEDLSKAAVPGGDSRGKVERKVTPSGPPPVVPEIQTSEVKPVAEKAKPAAAPVPPRAADSQKVTTGGSDKSGCGCCVVM